MITPKEEYIGASQALAIEECGWLCLVGMCILYFTSLNIATTLGQVNYMTKSSRFLW